MKVGVLGGTGKMGGAVAGQLSRKHSIIIGSREPARAMEAAAGIPRATGSDYAGAAGQAEAVIIAVPFSAIGEVAALADGLAGKLVVSMVNPLKVVGGLLEFALEKGSAAEKIKEMLPKSRVATAFNNVPRAIFENEPQVAIDILVAADSKATYDEAAALVRDVPGCRPLYAGPLSQAEVVERITPLVLNLARLNGTGALTTRFISRTG